MVFEHIEELKRQYTDKYVVVDASRPDLKRFEGFTGTVKTVNMSGKALVQFDAYDNIGWFDIDTDYLTIIDKPLPKAEIHEKEPKKKAPAEKQAPAQVAGKQPAAKMSVQEMLAAARGKQPAATKVADAPSGTVQPAAVESAAKPAAAMSAAEILAAARAGKPAAKPAPAKPAPKTTAAATPEPVAQESITAEPIAKAAVADTTPRAELPTTVAGIVAFCRQRDKK